MRREELRHLIRAACRVTGEQQVIVMGSQAILGSWKEVAAPDRVTFSNEADIAFFADPEESKADAVMGVLGLDSQFHQTFGVYADGITADSPILAEGWETRLIPIVAEDGGDVYVGWCLDPVDLCASKMAAARPKDHEFVAALVGAAMVDPDKVAALVRSMTIHPDQRDLAAGLLKQWRGDRWDAERARQIERQRQSSIRDLRRQCPIDAPPRVEFPPRCGRPTSDGPCRQLRNSCFAHPAH